jgi:hypothetical protein
MLTCTYLAKRLRELSSTKTGSYPHEFLCRTDCSACADYQPCLDETWVNQNHCTDYMWLPNDLVFLAKIKGW